MDSFFLAEVYLPRERTGTAQIQVRYSITKQPSWAWVSHAFFFSNMSSIYCQFSRGARYKLRRCYSFHKVHLKSAWWLLWMYLHVKPIWLQWNKLSSMNDRPAENGYANKNDLSKFLPEDKGVLFCDTLQSFTALNLRGKESQRKLRWHCFLDASMSFLENHRMF